MIGYLVPLVPSNVYIYIYKYSCPFESVGSMYMDSTNCELKIVFKNCKDFPVLLFLELYSMTTISTVVTLHCQMSTRDD
jgi:hypothetical protein